MNKTLRWLRDWLPKLPSDDWQENRGDRRVRLFGAAGITADGAVKTQRGRHGLADVDAAIAVELSLIHISTTNATVQPVGIERG